MAAARLAEATPAVQIRSDVERKRLAGLSPLERSGSGLDSGLYSPGMSARTYARLLALSRTVLESGMTAIADATFLKADQRAPFRALAAELGVPFRILAPEASEGELRRRVAERLARGDDPAEANVEVLDKQLAAIEPLSASERGCLIGDAGT
jgi:predicted kinase